MEDELLNDIDIDDLLDEMDNELEPISNLDENDDFFDYKPLPNAHGKRNPTDKILQNSIDKNIKDKKKKEKLDGLSIEQLQAIELICKGVKNAEIARQIGVSAMSITKWKRNDKFLKVLEKTKRDYINTFQQLVMSKVPLAVQTLVNAMEYDDVPYKDKISASRTILEFSNIKKGGYEAIKDEDSNPNSVQVITINLNAPNETPTNTNKDDEENMNIADEIIDAEIKEK